MPPLMLQPPLLAPSLGLPLGASGSSMLPPPPTYQQALELGAMPVVPEEGEMDLSTADSVGNAASLRAALSFAPMLQSAANVVHAPLPEVRQALTNRLESMMLDAGVAGEDAAAITFPATKEGYVSQMRWYSFQVCGLRCSSRWVIPGVVVLGMG